MGVIAKGIPRGCQGLFTPVSLGYPLSVFNKNSTLKEPAHKRQLISTVYASPLMTPTTDLGLPIRLSMFELRETGDWDISLGPPERARAETGGADQWVLRRREFSGFARVNEVISASLGYPPSVFNQNSTLRS